MQTVDGEITEIIKSQKYDVVIHGCNCFHKWGAGIAKYMAKEFPEAVKADKETEWGDQSKLGSYTISQCGDTTIVNAYTQYRYGRSGHVDYDALEDVFELIAEDFKEKTIAFPKIGAGLGGGSWSKIKAIIDDKLRGMDYILIVFD
jgi:O-acetyl-ADP-ribose deacetylase (regulator of RNase III)